MMPKDRVTVCDMLDMGEACFDGVLDWILDHDGVIAVDPEKYSDNEQITRVARCDGFSDGYGNDDGDSNGYGDGFSEGYGYGYGNGDGEGNGYGNGNGEGNGFGDGYGG